MKYLLIEDSVDKIEAIEAVIKSADEDAAIEFADNLADARVQILSRRFDLIIFDLLLPSHKGEAEIDVSADVIHAFTKSLNARTETIVLTKYEEQGLARSPLFNGYGITVVNYGADTRWQPALKDKISKVTSRPRFDFLIFCALPKERAAFSSTEAIVGNLISPYGLNCQEVDIGHFRGLCIQPQRMGLISMAIVASKAIEQFSPAIVAMSGICAGVSGETQLLDVVIGDVCWEYQTGKFKDGQFRQEPYQASLNPGVRVELQQFCERSDVLKTIKEGLYDTELKSSSLKLGVVSSGSAVIADAQKMVEIGLQHRKFSALEMEMYALYEAASQSQLQPLVFAAKSVVDLGDSNKGDSLHTTACILSARAVVQYLKEKLPKLAL